MASWAPDSCTVLAEVTRSGFTESIHFGAIAVVTAFGDLLAASGDPQVATFLRSTAKPFQSASLVRAGVPERFGWGDCELALTAGSHSGEPGHVSLVARILARAGLTESALQCGSQRPFHEPSARALEAAGEPVRPIHNNCSGKHAGMLAAAVAGVHPIDSYPTPDHPVQQANRRLLARLAGKTADAIETGVDGCGVPTFRLSLGEAALALARLADGRALDDADAEAGRRVFDAMRQHPWLVGGTDRLDTDVMAAIPGLVAKAGAEAFYGLAIEPGRLGDQGVGVALKVADGGDRARGPIVVEVLEQLGLLTRAEALDRHGTVVLRNRPGDSIGTIQPAFSLTWR